jgi:putative transposase
MDERLRFVARLLEGEKMAPLCAEFGISRKTTTRSSTGTRTAACRRSLIAADGRIVRRIDCRRSWKVIVRLKREYPGWGAPKIREKLRRQSCTRP